MKVDVTTQAEERPVEVDPKDSPEAHVDERSRRDEPSRGLPDLSGAQLGYLRSVLWLPSD